MIKDYKFIYYIILAGIIHIITILPLTIYEDAKHILNKMSSMLVSYPPVN